MPKVRQHYRSAADKAKAKDRPWANIGKRVRTIPNYALPKPYQKAKIWHPGDQSHGFLHTGERVAPQIGEKPAVRTMIMPSGSGHHPYGPSVIERFDPKNEGCGNFLPHKGTTPQAEEGTVQHVCSVDGNLERLGGNHELEEEVNWARGEIQRIYDHGFKDAKYGGREDRRYDGEEHVETTFGIEGLNFGTVDRMRFSADGMRAVVIDLKFGRWPVTPAKRNLQIANYAVFAFFLNRPMPASVEVYILHAKSRVISKHIYWRRSVYMLKARIAKVIERVEHGKKFGPETIGFYPNPSNCAWCERINCPARINLGGSLVSLWSGKPFVLPVPELLDVSTEQLGILKSFANALSRCVEAINDECKRRAFDMDDLIPGYEIREKSGKRRIVGADNITAACNIVMDKWREWFPGMPLDLSKAALELTELGVDDIETAAQRAAPRGSITKAKTLVAELLDDPSLVQNNKIFYLAQKIGTQEK